MKVARLSETLQELCLCPNLKVLEFNLYFVEGGSWIMHMCRFFVFGGFTLYHAYNLRNISQHGYNDSSKIMLPVLSTFLNLFLVLNGLFFLATGIDSLEKETVCGAPFNNILIALESGLYHMLYEGIAIFLCRYGIGWGTFRSSLFVGLCWGIFSFFIFFLVSDTICHAFNLPELDKYLMSGSSIDGIDSNGYSVQRGNEMAFGISIFYRSCLLVFYLLIWQAPETWFYRRPSAYFYSKYSSLLQVYWIISTSVFYAFHSTAASTTVTCVLTVMSAIVLVLVVPFIINQAFIVDSIYWQGSMVSEDNPTSELWLQNDIDTATALARKVGQIDTRYFLRSNKVKLLHFGMLNIDYSKGFVSGGFSRVYFGTQKQRNANGESSRTKTSDVAIKVIYAMELSPIEISLLCEEAKTLAKLQHPNIVICNGVCVMPPALALVFEYCKYGSLYTLLYKPVDMDVYEKEIKNDTLLGIRGADRHGNPVSRNLLSVFGNGFNFMRLISDSGSGAASATSATRPSLTHRVSATRDSNIGRLSDTRTSWTQRVSSTRDSNIGRLSDIGNPIKDGRWSLSSTMHGGDSEKYTSLLSLDSGASSILRTSSHTMNPLCRESEVEMHVIKENEDQDESKTLSDGFNYSEPSIEALRHTSLASQLPLHTRLKMMKECATALAFIHEKQYIHCDIKSLNFLVTNNFTVKLSDMGDARMIGAERNPNMGVTIPSRNWAAPELVAKDADIFDVYTPAADVYGLGIVLSELINIRLPFSDNNASISPDAWHAMILEDSFRPELDAANGFSDELLDVVRSSWITNPSKRCSSQDLVDAIHSEIEKK